MDGIQGGVANSMLWPTVSSDDSAAEAPMTDLRDEPLGLSLHTPVASDSPALHRDRHIAAFIPARTISTLDGALEAIDRFVTGRNVDRMRSIDFSHEPYCNLDSDGRESVALALFDGWRTLLETDTLEGNDFAWNSTRGTHTLSIGCTRGISHTPFGRESFRALMAAACNHDDICSLEVSGRFLDDDAIETIALSLLHLESPTALVINGSFGDRGAQVLAEGIRRTNALIDTVWVNGAYCADAAQTLIEAAADRDPAVSNINVYFFIPNH